MQYLVLFRLKATYMICYGEVQVHEALNRLVEEHELLTMSEVAEHMEVYAWDNSSKLDLDEFNW